MADLDTLRPEVREAVKNFDDLLGGFGDVREFRWQTIRAELLRFGRAEKAEAELAALKARIAEAPTAIVGRCALNSSPEYNIVTAYSPLDGKRVRLVVED